MELSGKAMGALLFVGGVAVGLNYHKIKKRVQPTLSTVAEKAGDAYGATVKFLANQKENVEDLVAKIKSKGEEREEKSVRGKKRALAAA